MPKIRHYWRYSQAMHNHPSQLITVDEQSFEMLYRTYAKKLFRFCCAYLRDEKEAKNKKLTIY